MSYRTFLKRRGGIVVPSGQRGFEVTSPLGVGTALGVGIPPVNEYFVPEAGSVSTSAGLGNGGLRLVPVFIPVNMTVDRIAAEVTVAGDLTSVYRMGIYTHDSTTNRPGTLVSGSEATIAGNVIAASPATISATLTKGIYWVGGAVQGVTVTQPTMRISAATGRQLVSFGTLATLMGATNSGYLQSGVTGALPATFAGTSINGFSPRIALRRAS